MGFDCKIQDLGLIDYDKCYLLQQELSGKVTEGCSQTILFCEHNTIITLGRLAKKDNILFDYKDKRKDITIKETDRGGDVTLHSPGQLVVYPIFNLKNYGKDIKYFLRKLEQVSINLLKIYGISGYSKKGQIGVYVGDKKIVSFGIGIKKWVSFHGFAINVNNDINLFKKIRPCNMDATMVSMKNLLQKDINFDNIKSNISNCFSEVFNLHYIK